VGTKFTVDEISDILEMMRSNEVTEFRLELGEGKLWLKRGSDTPPPVVQYVPQAYAPQGYAPQAYPQQPQAPQATAPAAVVTPTAAAPIPEKKYHEVKSPMVGTFYKRASPDAAPYVQVGDTIKKGQVLCIVEAMKLMNEIQSDISGKIVEACLEDGQMSEYGEVLFRVDTGA